MATDCEKIKTVDDFLEHAGVSRTKFHSKKSSGYNMDHVVELQLIVAAIKHIPTVNNNKCYSRPGWTKELADFFNEKHNMCERPEDENKHKAEAISRWIDYKLNGEDQEDVDLEEGDEDWINKTRNKWKALAPKLMKKYQFQMFIKSMDDILA